MTNKNFSHITLVILLSTTLLGNSLFEDIVYKDEALKSGKKIYEKTCISCHGELGEVNSEIKLVVKPRKLSKSILSAEQTYKVIRSGSHHWGSNSDLMPTFKYVLDDDVIKDLTYYVTQTFNSNRDEKVSKLLKESKSLSKEEKSKMLEVGKIIFTKRCTVCHGTTGNGKSDYAIKSRKTGKVIYPYDLTKTLLDKNQIFLYTKFGGHFWGTDQNNLDSCNLEYTDVELKSVAKYVNEKIKKIKE
ncbi:c-type cytochrome [Sulfurimonas sp.]